MPARSVCLTSTVLDPCTSWASVGALVLQLLPPSSEYSTVAPLSMPVSASEGSLVTWSLPEEPVSLASATLGRRRHPGVEGEGEGCRRGDVAGEVGLAHLDGVGPLHQLGEGGGAGAPVAAAVERVLDRGPALDAGQRQRRIVGDLVAARGAGVVGQRHARRGRVAVSRVKAKEAGVETLPARSVWRTSTVLDPCTSWAAVGALVLQLLPPSSEYSTVAPLSMPVSVSEASLVTWSLPEEPVSLVSATLGAAGTTGVEGEGEGGGGRDVAGEVGLPHLDGVGPLHQLGEGRGAGAPVAAAVERVLDRGPALDAGQRQRGIVGDLVAARGAGVVGQRHAGRGRGRRCRG